jgi:hypothetical protein
MHERETIEGQPSHVLSNTGVRLAVTVQGGHLTARFATGGRWVDPFYTAPWWNEVLPPDTPPVIGVMRGDFFCLPFGNEPPTGGQRHRLPHGRTANDAWRFEGASAEGPVQEFAFSMDLGPGEGRVRKRICIVEGEPVIYQEHLISGCPGPLPLGHHPILKLPDREGAGILDMSPPVAGFTTPQRIEEPANGGYSSIAPGREITDRSRVPTELGATVDLTRYPTPRGFEELVCFVSDPHRKLVFSSVSVPQEGWLYFQLKDPRVLAETVLWMSNGGRHYPPWSGRVVSVLGLEEVTAFFHYGKEASLGANFFRERGFPCVCEPGPEGDIRVRFLMGLVPIDRTFAGVQDIVPAGDGVVRIRGRGGESIEVPCRVDSLYG